MANAERIVNCTPHPVSIIFGTLFDPDLGHSIGGTQVAVIPPSGYVATAKSSIQARTPLVVDDVPVPTCKRQFCSVSPLPAEGDYYIVSTVYAQACAELGLDTSKLLSPYGTVKDNGNIIGCTGLVRN